MTLLATSTQRANVTIIDQYNWFAGLVNSIVEVRPKTFDEFFSMRTNAVTDYMIPKNLYSFSHSLINYAQYGVPVDGGYSANNNIEMFIAMGAPVLFSGDLPDNVATILEEKPEEIYTRTYDLNISTGQNLKRRVYDINIEAERNYNSDLFNGNNLIRVKSGDLIHFENITNDPVDLACLIGEDFVLDDRHYSVGVKSTLDSYVTVITEMVEVSKSQSAIDPLEYDQGRIVPENLAAIFSNIQQTGIYSGVLLDSPSASVVNTFYYDKFSSLQNSIPFVLGDCSWPFGDYVTVWNTGFLQYDFFKESCFSVTSYISPVYIDNHLTLKKREILKNRGSYSIIPYYVSGFKWITIQSVKDIAAGFNIPFKFRRTSTSYEFKHFEFDVATTPQEYMVPFSATGYNYPGTPPTAPLGIGTNGRLIYHDSAIQYQTIGSYGENTIDSNIFGFSIFGQTGSGLSAGSGLSGSGEAGFFEINGDQKFDYNIQLKGYYPWIYEIDDFVFSDSGNWCAPFTSDVELSSGFAQDIYGYNSDVFIQNRKPLIHNLNKDESTDFQMYKYDLVKGQTLPGATMKARPIDGSAVNSIPKLPHSENFVLPGACGLTYPVISWMNCLNKIMAMPIFSIDTDPDYKEMMVYRSAFLNPKNCLIQDYSSFGGVEKIFIKDLGIFSLTPPDPQSGIGISLMRTYGAADTRSFGCFNHHAITNHGEDHAIFGILNSNYTRQFLYPPLVSTIPEVDVNYFLKGLNLNYDDAPIYVENFSGPDHIVNMDGHPNGTHGGVYKLGFYVDDTITVD